MPFVREGGACFGAKARDDVEHAPRQANLLRDGSQLEACHAGNLRGLEHAGVAGGEGGGNLPRGHEQWVVPWGDERDDAQGLADDLGVKRVIGELHVLILAGVELLGEVGIVLKAPGNVILHIQGWC